MRGFGHETQRNYTIHVHRLATYLGRSPGTVMADDVPRLQIKQRNLGVPVSTTNIMISAPRSL